MPTKQAQSWVVTDEFWARVEPLIPELQRATRAQYLRKPGAGRPPKPARQVFEAVVYVLCTRCQWKALPKERFGSASAVHKRFLQWKKVGFFEALWKAGLAEYDQMEGIARRWQRTDGAMLKAPMAQQAVRPQPDGSGKKAMEAQRAVSFIAPTEASTGAALPMFVKDEFDSFLECGILAHGFLRLRCGERGTTSWPENHQGRQGRPWSCCAVEPACTDPGRLQRATRRPNRSASSAEPTSNSVAGSGTVPPL